MNGYGEIRYSLKVRLENEIKMLKNNIEEKNKIIELNKESFIYKNDRIKALNEIVENDKEIIAKLNKELREAENKIKKEALTKVVDRENFFSNPLDDYINKRFELINKVDDNKIAKAFNMKSFEQLENENKSLHGQIKKQASVIKDLKSIKSKSRIEDNKTNAYLEKLVDKNRALNEKLSNQADTIEYLMRFKKLYNDGIYVKTSLEQVGIVTISQDELNNLRCENEDMKKTISKLNKSNGLLQDFKQEIVETLCCVKGWDIENLKIDDIIIKEIIGGIK